MTNNIVNQRKRFILPRGLINFAILLVYIIIIFLPIIALAIDTISYVLYSGKEWISLIIPSQRKWGLLIQSVLLSGLTAIFSSFIGIVLASKFWEFKKGTGNLLKWLIMLLLVIPPYIHTHAWGLFVDRINNLLSTLNIGIIVFQGFWASCFVETIAFLPVTTGLALLGMAAIDRELIDAGRITSNDFTVFCRIILPLSIRIISAGAGLVFLLSLVDYTIPSLLQFDLYALEIFAEFSATSEPARACLLSLPIVALSLIVFGFTISGMKTINLSKLWNQEAQGKSFKWPSWFKFLQRIVIGVFVCSVLVPLISLIFEAESFKKFIDVVRASSQEFYFSILIAVLSALFSIILAVLITWAMTSKWVRGKILWILIGIPLAIPAPLIGIGLISIWNNPDIVIDIYGTVLMPIFAGIIRFSVIAILILYVYSSRINSLLLDAGKVYANNRLKYFLGIRLPMVFPGLMAGFFFVFTLVIGELGATLIVAPPGKATLTMKIYNYLHYGGTETIAGLCLAVVIITMVSGVIGLMQMGKKD
ncbi:MAG: ABC transporter permease [Ignavibacteriales bacterium]